MVRRILAAAFLLACPFAGAGMTLAGCAWFRGTVVEVDLPDGGSIRATLGQNAADAGLSEGGR